MDAEQLFKEKSILESEIRSAVDHCIENFRVKTGGFAPSRIDIEMLNGGTVGGWPIEYFLGAVYVKIEI